MSIIDQRITELQSLIDDAPPAISQAWTAFLSPKRIIEKGGDEAVRLMAVVTEDPRFLAAVEFMSPLHGELLALMLFKELQPT